MLLLSGFQKNSSYDVTPQCDRQQAKAHYRYGHFIEEPVLECFPKYPNHRTVPSFQKEPLCSFRMDCLSKILCHNNQDRPKFRKANRL